MAARKPMYRDWYSEERIGANTLEAALCKAVPAQWGRYVGVLREPGEAEPFWCRMSGWLERLQAFEAAHGEAIRWDISDDEICTRARAIAGDVSELLNPHPHPLSEVERLDVVRLVCAGVGVAAPVAVTGGGAIARALSDVWWRRVLRKKVARIVEHGAIKLGVVNKHAGGYASDGAVERRMQQQRRNEAMLSKTLMRNEAGQVYTLAELAAVSVANRDVRRGELMTRIRGCEEFADERGHAGVFLTLTCPSRFHAMLAPGKGRAARPNPRYLGGSPRDAQMWLRDTWARARAELGRQGLRMYGFRVAEPHHDGCPHWHALLWFDDAAAAFRAGEVIREYWLRDGGDEPGAQKNRVNIKRMDAGGAAGYVAKYIAKNVGAADGGDVGLGAHRDGVQQDAFDVATGAVQGFQRVDAWAATWGIRQFQPLGQPPVTVWREMRRVSKDQVEDARIEGEGAAWRAFGAVHRVGDALACWRRYLEAQGGVCLPRAAWALQTARRVVESVNLYGEAIKRKITVGVSLLSGRWLVSRRQSWCRVVDVARDSCAALAAPWTGFNNCTARLGGELRAGLMGADWGLRWRGSNGLR